MKKMKTAVCCIACQENAYIHEWLEHYQNLGFTNIYIYDNNKSYQANEHFEDVISDFIESGFAKIIDKRDVSSLSFQSDCYNEFYSTYGKEYDWIFYYDCDEFLELKHFDNIEDFLNQPKFEDFHIIKINWLSYNDNGNVYKTDAPVQERFPNPSDITKEKIIWENRLLKSAVRGGLDTSKISIGIHTPVPIDNGKQLAVNISDPSYRKQKQDIESSFKWEYRVCFADGEESFDICYPNCFTPGQPKYDDAVIKHYRTKSCQEYVETKAYRGFQDCDKKILNSGTYFYFNEYAPEKMEYFSKAGLEDPILLIDTDETNLGEMMSTYAAAKYAIRNISYHMEIYWKNNNYYKVYETIKNTTLFNDVHFFSQTVLQDIKFLKNCGEYHYIDNLPPANKYIYEPVSVELGRNIRVMGNRLSWKYFDDKFIADLFNKTEITNEIHKMLNGFDLMNTAAVFINDYTRKEDLTKFFDLYRDNVTYFIVADEFEKASKVVLDAYNAFFEHDQADLKFSWPNKPSETIGMDVVKMYMFACCRVNFVNFSDPVVWMGTMLNINDYADILYPNDDDKIFSLLLPNGDTRYKNIENVTNEKNEN